MKRLSLNIEESEIDCVRIAIETEVSSEKEIKEQPIAISRGWYTEKGESKPIPFASYGDFSCIVGASKSKKSYLAKAIVACCIGGQIGNRFNEFKGHGFDDKYILILDTEQSNFHVQKGAIQIKEMVGSYSDKLRLFALRGKSVNERVEFLKWLMLESEYAGKIGLVVLDGAADLVHSVNDELASYELAQLFLQLTAESEAHLIAILHKNSAGNKPTGHLGSAILKKAETVAFLKVSDGVTEVKPEYTRNHPFRKFSFELDKDFLPILTDLNDNIFTDEDIDDKPF